MRKISLQAMKKILPPFKFRGLVTQVNTNETLRWNLTQQISCYESHCDSESLLSNILDHVASIHHETSFHIFYNPPTIAAFLMWAFTAGRR